MKASVTDMCFKLGSVERPRQSWRSLCFLSPSFPPLLPLRLSTPSPTRFLSKLHSAAGVGVEGITGLLIA